jgi:hypothetical protein
VNNFTTKLNMGNGPYVLVDAPTPLPLVVPPFPMAPLPLAFSLPLTKLMSRVVIVPLGATIPLMIET